MSISIAGAKTIYVGQTDYLKPVVMDQTYSPAVPAVLAQVGAGVTTTPGIGSGCTTGPVSCFEIHGPIGAVDGTTGEAPMKVTGHWPTDDWDYNEGTDTWAFHAAYPGTVTFEELTSGGASYSPQRLANVIVTVGRTFTHLVESSGGTTSATAGRGDTVNCKIRAVNDYGTGIPNVWVGCIVPGTYSSHLTVTLANGMDTYTDANGEATMTIAVAPGAALATYYLKAKLPSIAPEANCNEAGSGYDGKSVNFTLTVDH